MWRAVSGSGRLVYLMSWEFDQERLAKALAKELQPLGQVSLKLVCRTVYKVTLTDISGITIRILVGVDCPVERTFFIYVTRIFDGMNRTLCDRHQTFRPVRLGSFSFDPVVARVTASLDAVIALGSRPRARRSGPSALRAA